jgi:hypothetical protein
MCIRAFLGLFLIGSCISYIGIYGGGWGIVNDYSLIVGDNIKNTLHAVVEYVVLLMHNLHFDILQDVLLSK